LQHGPVGSLLSLSSRGGLLRDGKTLATVARFAPAILWDVAGGGEPVKVADFWGRRPAISSTRYEATFARDGRTLAIDEGDFDLEMGAVGLWDLSKPAELRADPSAQACAITGRGLTEDEWARYLPELEHQPTCSG